MPRDNKNESDSKIEALSLPIQRALYLMLMQYQHNPKLSFAEAIKIVPYIRALAGAVESLQVEYGRITGSPAETRNEEIQQLSRSLGYHAEESASESDDEDDSVSMPQALKTRCQAELSKYWKDYHFNWEQIRELTLKGGELDKVLEGIDSKLKKAGLKDAQKFYMLYLKPGQGNRHRNEKAFWKSLEKISVELELHIFKRLKAVKLFSGKGDSLDRTELWLRFRKLWSYLLKGIPGLPHSADDILALCRGLCGVTAVAGDMEAEQLHSFWSRFPSPVDSDDWNCVGGTYTRFNQSLIFGNCFYNYLANYVWQQTITWNIGQDNEVHRDALAPALAGHTTVAKGDPNWKTPLDDLCADQLLAVYTQFGAETLQQAIADDLSEVIAYGNHIVQSWRERLVQMEKGTLPEKSVPKNLSDEYLDKIIQASPLLSTLAAKKEFKFLTDRDFIVEDGQPARINVSKFIHACVRGLEKLKVIGKGQADTKQTAAGLCKTREHMCQLLPKVGRRLFGLYPWLRTFEGKSMDDIVRELQVKYNKEKQAEAPWLLPLSPLIFEAMAEKIFQLLREFDDLRHELGGIYLRLFNVLVPLLCEEEEAIQKLDKIDDINFAGQCVSWLLIYGADYPAFVYLFDNVISEELWDYIKKEDKIRTNFTHLPFHPQAPLIIQHYGDCLALRKYWLSVSHDIPYHFNTMGICINAVAYQGADRSRVCELIQAMAAHDISICLTPCIKDENNNSLTPLQLACLYGQMEILCQIAEILHKKQATINNFNFLQWLDKSQVLRVSESFYRPKINSKRSCLHIAAMHGDADVVRRLCNLGADKEIKDGDKMTPLQNAALFDRAEVVRELCMQNANKEAEDKNGMTALHLAATWDSPKAACVLCEQGANKEAQSQDKMTALHLAATWGSKNTARVLCEQGANKEAKDSDMQTPLMVAVMNRHLEAIPVLCEMGANKEARNKFDETPLMFAARKGYTEAVRMLCVQDADKEATFKNGLRPFHIAVIHDQFDVVRELCEQEADKEAKNDFQQTPLHMTAVYNSVGALRVLCELGANIEAKDGNGRTPLALAIAHRSNEAEQVLREFIESD